MLHNLNTNIDYPNPRLCSNTDWLVNWVTRTTFATPIGHFWSHYKRINLDFQDSELHSLGIYSKATTKYIPTFSRADLKLLSKGVIITPGSTLGAKRDDPPPPPINVVTTQNIQWFRGRQDDFRVLRNIYNRAGSTCRFIVWSLDMKHTKKVQIIFTVFLSSDFLNSFINKDHWRDSC